jgi:polyhydroxyalkanoate synthesis repressor PhaR
MNEPRVIKKYPNRRLYDTVESRYITLADVRKLVVEQVEFVVIDKKSQEDITRCILLQVIADLEQAAEPLMSRDFLSQVIRSHDTHFHDMIGSYLEQSFKLFASHQRDARERNKGDGDSLQVVVNLAQKNYQRWRSVQEEIYRTLVNAANGARRDSAGDDGADARPP